MEKLPRFSGENPFLVNVSKKTSNEGFGKCAVYLSKLNRVLS